MLEMHLDREGQGLARYMPADTPPYLGEEGTVDRIEGHLEEVAGDWTYSYEEIDLEQAVGEVMAYSGLGDNDARAALLKSTAHTGYESPFEMDDPEPLYIEAHPLLETRANEAQAKQRALQLSRALPAGEARVMESDGEVIAVYKCGALYSPATGEQLTPAG